MADSKEELKSLLMKVKEENEKFGLKLNTQKSKIMASNPITSWQIDGEKNGNSGRLYFLGLQNHCRWLLHHEIKGCLLLGRKAMTNLDSILKSRDVTLATKVHLVKAMDFPVVKYECERWTIKKAECQITDAFKWWCWRRLLRIPWTTRRSTQSILKEINSEYSLEGLGWSPCGPRDSQESSPAPPFKSINYSALSLLYGPTLTFILLEKP